MYYYKRVKLEVHGKDRVMQIWKNETVRHWQYNVILTQNTGAIKYSVSNSVKEKGTIVKRKKPLVNVWSACEELAIIHEESSSSTNKLSLYGYISTVYFDENLTKIKVVVIYGICTHDRPEGIWDFRPFVN